MRQSRSVVRDNGCVVGVDYMLNIDSIRSSAGLDTLMVLSRQWALSKARGAAQNHESKEEAVG
jgi:hypothetical protein